MNTSCQRCDGTGEYKDMILLRTQTCLECKEKEDEVETDDESEGSNS